MTIQSLSDIPGLHLRVRAAADDAPREQDARDTPCPALLTEPVGPSDLAQAIHERFAALGGVVLPEVSRQTSREPPSFEASSSSTAT